MLSMSGLGAFMSLSTNMLVSRLNVPNWKQTVNMTKTKEEAFAPYVRQISRPTDLLQHVIVDLPILPAGGGHEQHQGGALYGAEAMPFASSASAMLPKPMPPQPRAAAVSPMGVRDGRLTLATAPRAKLE
eukprot:CAMPEP_0195121524 /NCGR_PEP_ID=MMETSP0448-20130528/124444_1 /TAXON_ID=66468 /ORGANISM="Heterocapsa triquestra, Strain CCMP 448" /LENGTH=129 /DNA_ID=CAMNT_0040158997 /DNA_START=114 /DNA_END=501 /DNA_ORIENTATION=+